MALQLLHSFCFTVMSFFMMRYINAIAPDSLKAGGQLLYTLFTLGIARIKQTYPLCIRSSQQNDPLKIYHH